MEKEEIKIERVEVKIGDNTIALTIDQAKTLRDVLISAFPKDIPILKEYIPYPVYPYYPPWTITYIETDYPGQEPIPPGNTWGENSTDSYNADCVIPESSYTLMLSCEG